jgi:hypothetical protein
LEYPPTEAEREELTVAVALPCVLRSKQYGTPSDFVRWVSLAIGWTVLVATIFTLFPVFTTSTCG